MAHLLLERWTLAAAVVIPEMDRYLQDRIILTLHLSIKLRLEGAASMAGAAGEGGVILSFAVVEDL